MCNYGIFCTIRSISRINQKMHWDEDKTCHTYLDIVIREQYLIHFDNMTQWYIFGYLLFNKLSESVNHGLYVSIDVRFLNQGSQEGFCSAQHKVERSRNACSVNPGWHCQHNSRHQTNSITVCSWKQCVEPLHRKLVAL